MTHDELLANISSPENDWRNEIALRAVVELHKPETVIVDVCLLDGEKYPCSTIQAIEKELK